MSSRAETLKLYRDILKSCRVFSWNNEKGIKWSNILKENARKEFEQSKYEKDPLIIAQLLFVGRDCLNKTNESLLKAKEKIESDIDKSRIK